MIRKHKSEEIKQLVDIWEAASSLAHPFLSDYFTQNVKKAMGDIYLPNSDTWVFEADGTLIGFISMMENEIGGLFISPNHHSKGIGTQLVKHVAQSHDSLEVEVFLENKIGRPFYEKKGFIPIKQYLHEETGEQVLRMRFIPLNENL